jgi:hypothetical protein
VALLLHVSASTGHLPAVTYKAKPLYQILSKMCIQRVKIQFCLLKYCWTYMCRSQLPCSLRRRYAAARLLRLWVRIPPGTWMSCEGCVLSGRSLWDELITRPEESYRLWCVVVCDLETSWMRGPWPTGRGGGGCRTQKKKKKGKNV